MKINLIFIMFLIAAFSAPSYPITPQKYCESLPLASCEVLNTRIAPVSTGAGYATHFEIKYCRDRRFSTFIAEVYQVDDSTLSSNLYTIKPADGEDCQFRTKLDSASLCTAISAAGSSDCPSLSLLR